MIRRGRRATRHNSFVSRRVRGVCSVVVIAGALLLAAGIFGGCSGEKRHKVLSFFFDGVPDPNAPAVANGEGEDSEFAQMRKGGPGAPKMLVVVHKPYADNNCNACHENATGRFDDFQKLDSSVCMKCHEPVKTKFPVMHGPVAVGECNLCHVPHESTTLALLKETNSTLCTQCHQPELLSSTPREHLTPDKNSCIDCHSGHGGEKHGLLKPNRPATRPATTKPTTRRAIASGGGSSSRQKGSRPTQQSPQAGAAARGGEIR